MNNEDAKVGFTRNEKVSNIILLFLCILRLADNYLLTLRFGTSMPDWVPHWYAGIAYILTAVIVFLNRHRLKKLNIDRPFMIALMLGGFLYVFHLPAGINIVVAITTALVYWAYRNNYFLLENTIQYPPSTILLISVFVPLAILPIYLFGFAIKVPPNIQMILSSFFEASLGLVVYEEVLFRGVLWAYLLDLGLKERTAFLLTAVLFWTAHSRLLLFDNTYSFWVTVPIASLLLGVLAWRSRSLTPSTIGHFLYNFTSVLIKKMI